MSDQTIKNGLGSTTLHYEATGTSKKTNALGMREMQANVWEKRDAQHLLAKSPPASGKSRAAMFIGLEKLRTKAVRKVVIAVPERSIGASFRDTALAKHGFHTDWTLDLDLCTVGSETGRKVDELIGFLGAEEGGTALCTHSTLRAAYAKTNSVEMFDGCLVCVDELHHASADENSRLGNLLRGLIDRAGQVGQDAAHILAMTGSYFRGDGTAVLHPEDEARFERVILHLLSTAQRLRLPEDAENQLPLLPRQVSRGDRGGAGPGAEDDRAYPPRRVVRRERRGQDVRRRCDRGRDRRPVGR